MLPISKKRYCVEHDMTTAVVNDYRKCLYFTENRIGANKDYSVFGRGKDICFRQIKDVENEPFERTAK